MMIDEDLWASKDIDDAPHVCRYNEGREEKPNMGIWVRVDNIEGDGRSHLRNHRDCIQITQY